MIGWIRKKVGRYRRERMRSTVERHASHLESIHDCQFADSDRERFMLLWCEMAEVFRVSVHGLSADTELRSLLSAKKTRWWEPSCQDDLEYLIAMESRGRPPPEAELRTVGDVLAYLLPSNASR
jgi:hypothetical protein